MSKSFTIIIINDSITECDENIKLMLSVDSPCRIATKDESQTEVVIKDNGKKVLLENHYVLFINTLINRSSVVI